MPPLWKSEPAPGRLAAIAAGVLIALAGGCAGKMGSVPNPFSSADKVPPPATRTVAPGTAAPYYPNDPLPQLTINPPAAGAPVVGTPCGSAPPFAAAPSAASGFPGSTGQGIAGQPTGAPPNPFGAAPALGASPITPYPPTPGGSGTAPSLPVSSPYAPYGSAPASGGAPPSTYSTPPGSPYSAVQSPPLPGMAARAPATFAPGDSIRAPSDSGPLRFEPQGPWAGAGSPPGARPPAAAPQYVAAAPPRASQLPATANGWVSGSAPVRSQVAASDPLRVRVPNGGIELREPVSVAALGGAPSSNRVQITPLDPLPAGAPAGDGRSPETLGWR